LSNPINTLKLYLSLRAKRSNLIWVCFVALLLAMTTTRFAGAKDTWKSVSPETAVTQTAQGWKATKIAKKEYDQLILQKKAEMVIKDKTAISFRYRIQSDREILYIQFGLISKRLALITLSYLARYSTHGIW
jgi:hypothetical protein